MPKTTLRYDLARDNVYYLYTSERNQLISTIDIRLRRKGFSVDMVVLGFFGGIHARYTQENKDVALKVSVRRKYIKFTLSSLIGRVIPYNLVNLVNDCLPDLI